MSTSTSLSRTSTTRPRTTSPSWISLTPRVNQSSMLSSGPWSTSLGAPARVLIFRLSGVSIIRHFLPLRFVAGAARLTVYPCCLVPLPHQLGDGAHHFLGGFTIALLASIVTHGLEDQGWTEAHADASGPRQCPSWRERPSGAGYVHWHHRRPAHHGEHARPRLPLPQPSLHPARPLGKEEYRTVLAEKSERRFERAAVRPVSLHRPRVEGVDEPPERSEEHTSELQS